MRRYRTKLAHRINSFFGSNNLLLFFHFFHLLISRSSVLPPNGLRYRLVGGTRQRHFDGTNFKPHKLPENAQTPTSRVHAVLGGVYFSAFDISTA
jgi:hypothetical protein